MIDYFKLLEVDQNSSISEITDKYYEKLDKLQKRNPMEFALKRRWYETAYLTLINNTNNRGHMLELKYAYDRCNLVDTETGFFSVDYEANKEIVKKVESAIFDYFLLKNNQSFEDAFSAFASKFSRSGFNDLYEIDNNAYVSTDNLLPYFCNCYQLIKPNEATKIKQKKITTIA